MAELRAKRLTRVRPARVEPSQDRGYEGIYDLIFSLNESTSTSVSLNAPELVALEAVLHEWNEAHRG